VSPRRPPVNTGLLKPKIDSLQSPSIPFDPKTDCFNQVVGPGTYDAPIIDKKGKNVPKLYGETQKKSGPKKVLENYIGKIFASNLKGVYGVHDMNF
jgi:hypothetical protein